MPSIPPSYQIPSSLAVQILSSALWMRPRSFKNDSLIAVQEIPALCQKGEITPLPPQARGWLVVPNHYSRPSFQAWWIGIAISALFPLDMNWVMTAAWRFEDTFRRYTLTPLTAWLFRRLARIYGFVSMPPMPPLPGETQARAVAVHQLVQIARTCPVPVIGLAPEGRDSPDGKLTTPPPGVGRLIAHLARLGLWILPTGVYEDANQLVVHFGEPYPLPQFDACSPHGLDACAARFVMNSIAQYLPTDMTQ